MHLKITSTHKNISGLDISNFRIGLNEFYTFPNNDILQLRGNVYRVDENDEKYPVELLPSDPLMQCVKIDGSVQEWAQDQEEVSLTGTRFNIAATLFFSLIIGKIDTINAETPGSISYQLVDVPTIPTEE